MPRKKQLDLADVRQKAMVAFWERGYRATSLDDLVGYMGINRASLYDTFGSKHTLFLETLYNYDHAYSRPYLAGKMKGHSPRQAILTMFEDLSDAILKDEIPYGCLIINTALELSPHDENAARLVHQSFAYLEKKFFRTLIKRGQASGEISTSVDPGMVSRTLLSLLIGLKVLSRRRPEKMLLTAIKNQVAALLPPCETGHPSPPHLPPLQESRT